MVPQLGADETRPDWPTCAVEGCLGVRMKDQEQCVAHVAPGLRHAFLHDLKPEDPLDLRGMLLSQDLFQSIRSALDVEGSPRFGAASFEKAQFLGDADFDKAQFSDAAYFQGAQFFNNASFRRAKFSEYANFGGTKFFGKTWLTGAQFANNVDFQAQFSRPVSFRDTQFSGEAVWFSDALFSSYGGFQAARFFGEAWFYGAQFLGAARFENAQFSRNAVFDKAHFSGSAWFDNAEFSNSATFYGVQFTGDQARFMDVQFGGGVGFDEAQFSSARFDRVQFSSPVGFDKAQFSGDVAFLGAQFATTSRFGPVIVAGELNLNETAFGVAVVIEASASRLSCLDATFRESVTLRVRFAQIALDRTAIAQPSALSFAREPFWPDAGISEQANAMDALARRPGSPVSADQPQIASIRRTDLVNLVVADCDLSNCLFEGAHNLDRLRIEGPPPFAFAPSDWVYLPLWRLRLPIGRLTHRQTLAEEHRWRSATSPNPPTSNSDGRVPHIRWPAWYPERCQPPEWLVGSSGAPGVLAPVRLAGLYRGLRKAFEDSKNAPGAADFYYGEMEMRRLSSDSWSDRLVLWTYWLVSGYGLRASRALVAFAVTVIVFSAGFWAWGLLGHPNYWIALLRTFESATSLLRPAPPGLSAVGDVLDALVRLLGTTLLGLALFSLRGRIKR